jgi:predicted signal transduction protein with EAL and GGDEF domain
VSFSVGAAVAPAESLNSDELFRRADARLYEDKARQRGLGRR